MQLRVNSELIEINNDYAGGMLLWALRDGAALTGTKFGCGVGICGACTVHIDGRPARACVTSVDSVLDAEVTTIEGLARDGDPLHAVQQAFIDEQAPQCAWCMVGQIMTAAALLRENSAPTNDEIISMMDGNYCRCGSYIRVRAAVARAANLLRG